MITLTRLKGDQVHLNPDLIETLEETPNTVVTLVDGKKFIVDESAYEIANLIVSYRASVLATFEKYIEAGVPTSWRADA